MPKKPAKKAAQKKAAPKKKASGKAAFKLSDGPYYDRSKEHWPTFVDAEEAAAVHDMWEVPAMAQLMWTLSEYFKLPGFSLRDFEIMVVEPSNSALLAEVVTKLLVPDGVTSYRFKQGDRLPFTKWRKVNIILKRRFKIKSSLFSMFFIKKAHF